MEQYGGGGKGAHNGVNASGNTEYENTFVTFFANKFLKDVDDNDVITMTANNSDEDELEDENQVVRFFDRGDYYTLHGKDAIEGASKLFKTQTVVKFWNQKSKFLEGGLPTINLSLAQAESYIRSCLSWGKVQVWSNGGGSKTSNSWNMIKSGTPGNWTDFEEIMEEHNGSSSHKSLGQEPVVLAVQLSSSDKDSAGALSLHIAIADASTRKLGYCNLVDNDLFTQFESALIQWGVKECLLNVEANQASLSKKLVDVIGKRSGIIITSVKKSEFAVGNAEGDLLRLVGETFQSDVKLLTTNPGSKSILGCFSCLFQYLHILADDSHLGQFHFSKLELLNHMKLDTASMRALHLLPSSLDAKSMSLFGLLNKCQTNQGSRLLNQYIRQPLIDKGEIETRLDFVELLISENEFDLKLREYLKNIPDLVRLCKKLQRGSANIQDLLTLYNVSLVVPKLETVISEYNGLHAELVKEKWGRSLKDDLLEPMLKYAEMINETVDLERANRHEYVLKADFDPELLDLRKRMDDWEAKIQPEFLRVCQHIDMEPHKKVKFEKSPIYGRHFRITRNEGKAISGKGYIELATQKNGVYFVTALMKEISESLASLEKEYTSKQNKMVKEVVKIASTYAQVFSLVNYWIAQVDVMLSFALVSSSSSNCYVRPEIIALGGGIIKFKDSRHPCVESLDNVNFISNDVDLIRGESDFQIITGPNMGGKSTFIRQAALVTLMGQIGCFVPCREAKISIVDAILARVGASDSQQKGISTFMAEMLETACILKRATKDSLIIIDELGRGTSTTDGFGLAVAISEYIIKNIGSFCLFATHFHELSVLAGENQNVRNYHVSALVSNNTITLLYKVKPGVCDQSFGIHVAEMTRFPKFVIELARGKSNLMENHTKSDEEFVVQDYPAKKIKTLLTDISTIVCRNEDPINPQKMDLILEKIAPLFQQ